MLHGKNGTLWFGADNGLYQFDKASGKATRYAGSPTVVGKTIQAITEDRRGHLWIGTKESGAVDLDPIERYRARLSRLARRRERPPRRATSARSSRTSRG